MASSSVPIQTSEVGVTSILPLWERGVQESKKKRKRDYPLHLSHQASDDDNDNNEELSGVTTFYQVPLMAGPNPQEMKAFDGDSFTHQIGAFASIKLCNPPEGTGPAERIGRQIMIHRIQFTFTLRNTAEQTPVGRVMLVRDRQNNGNVAIDRNGLLALQIGASPYMAQQNLDNASRYDILYEYFYSLPLGQGGREVHRVLRDVNFFMDFSVSLGVNPVTNGLYLCTEDDQPGVANTGILTYSTRVWYHDA